MLFENLIDVHDVAQSKKKATRRGGTAVAGKKSVSQLYRHQAPVSILPELVAGLLFMTQIPNLGRKDVALAWSWFEQVLRRYIEVRHGV